VQDKLHFGVLNGLLGSKGRDSQSGPKSLINIFIFIIFYFLLLLLGCQWKPAELPAEEGKWRAGGEVGTCLESGWGALGPRLLQEGEVFGVF